MPKSEDLPCARNLHRLRTMASCKNRLAHSSSILFAIPLVLLVACGNHPSGFFIVQGALFPIKKSRSFAINFVIMSLHPARLPFIPILISLLGEQPRLFIFLRKKKSGTKVPDRSGGYRDSNPGPPEPQSGALTSCAIPTITGYNIRNEPEGIRTPDPRLRRPLLYPAELQTQNIKHKAGDGNRTHVSSLEGWCSTIELHPQIYKSG